MTLFHFFQMASQQERTPRIYRPLAQLKNFYKAEAHSSSVEAHASSELPHIETKRKLTHFSTQSCQYSKTINDALKMKLKTGQIYDQISFMDLKMRRDKEKYDGAVLEHRNFTRAFDKFLAEQYQRVKETLQKLQAHEQQSSRLQESLRDLRQTITQKSLKIYELEAKWRQYKTCEKFLLHISPLLRRDPEKSEFPGNFAVNPDCKTPTLDELISNFRKHHERTSSFDESQYEHVTAAKMSDFLSKLKRQNLKILRYKLEQEKLTSAFADSNSAFEIDFRDEVARLDDKIGRVQAEAEDKIREVMNMKIQCDDISKDAEIFDKKDEEKLKSFVEDLYAQCFRPTYQEKSHVQMARYLEDYCHALLCELYSFEPCILKKVLTR